MTKCLSKIRSDSESTNKSKNIIVSEHSAMASINTTECLLVLESSCFLLKAKKGQEIDINSAGCGAARNSVLACSALDSIIPFYHKQELALCMCV